MKEYEVEVEFVDGTTVTIQVEAEDEEDALRKAMPINLMVY